MHLHRFLFMAVAFGLAAPDVARATPRVAGVHLHFPASTALSSPPLAGEVAWVARRGCRLAPADPTERARLEDAAALASRALDSPEFARHVLEPRDWVRRSADAWVRDPAAGSEALVQLVTSRRQVAVLVLDDGHGDTCRALSALDGLRAYAPEGADVVVFQRTYLRSEASARELAATLVHETLHVLGFSHPVGALDHGDPAYRRSVPVRLAALLLAADLAAGAPNGARPPTASRGGERPIEDAAPPDATSTRAAASEVNARRVDVSVPYSP
ncbi:MAG: hypothetical protein R3F39_05425 [Myxococcota bacterium]